MPEIPHTEGMTGKTKQIIKNIIYLSGITVAVYLGMRFVLPIVIPFLLAFFIAKILCKPVAYLKIKTKIPAGILSTVAVLIFLVVLFVPIGFFVYKGIYELALFVANYQKLFGEADALWCSCCKRFAEMTGIASEKIIQWGRTCAVYVSSQAETKLVPLLMNGSLASLKGIAAFFGICIVTLVAAVLILCDYENLAAYWKKSSFYAYGGRIWKNMCHAGGTYLKAQFIILSLISAVCIAGLFLTGNSCAVLAGILIGVSDALPFIGTGLVFIPWMIIDLFREKYFAAVIYGVLFILCTFIREFMEPRLMGKGLGVHPLAVIVSIYAGLKIYGTAGVILGPLSGFLIWEIYKSICGREKENI